MFRALFVAALIFMGALSATRLHAQTPPPMEAVTLDHRYHGQPRNSSHRIATESAAVAARTQQSRRRSGRNAGSDGKPIAQALGHGNNVGCNALVHMHKPAATAAHPGLDLVHPQ